MSEQAQNQSAVIQLEVADRASLTWPKATNVKERNRITSAMTWQAYKRANKLTGEKDKAIIKAHQNSFMAEKKQSRQQARRIAAALVASDGFDFTVDCWRNKKGEQQFNVRGKEIDEKQTNDVEAAVTARNEELRQKMLVSGLTEEQVTAIMGGN